MSGPSCKLYFSDENEYHYLVKIAAQHDLTLPQYIRQCAIKVTNDIIAIRAEQLAAENAKIDAATQTTTYAETTIEQAAVTNENVLPSSEESNGSLKE